MPHRLRLLALMLFAATTGMVFGLPPAPGHAQDDPTPRAQPVRECPPPDDLKWQPRTGTDDGTRVARDLNYRPTQTLDIYLPAGTGPHPVLLWLPGGAWTTGDKSNDPPTLMLQYGFAVVSINYRKLPQAAMPDQIRDVTAAVRWIRAWSERFHFNPLAIGAWGASTGGHLAALLGTASTHQDFGGGPNAAFSSSVQAVCDWYGPADLAAMSDVAKVKELLGNAQGDELTYRCRAASPITYVDRNDPPFLIQHGDADRVVPVDQSVRLHEALRAAGVHSTLHKVPGAGHARFMQPAVIDEVREFFVRHLRPPVPPDIAARRHRTAAERIASLDRDNDALVSRAEYPPDRDASFFDRVDVNRDGYVSEDELVADLDARRR
ncbi:MAG: alpha/beta hydrolase fold domain-containing protein [Planctomycetota bacterium]